MDKWEIHMEGGAWCGDAQSCTTWWGFRSSLVDPDVLLPDAQARCLRACVPVCLSVCLSVCRSVGRSVGLSVFDLRFITPTR